jgi:hypothetical protein
MPTVSITVQYDVTSTSLVDISDISEQPARCVLMVDNKDEGVTLLLNFRTYETTRFHIKEHHKLSYYKQLSAQCQCVIL